MTISVRNKFMPPAVAAGKYGVKENMEKTMMNKVNRSSGAGVARIIVAALLVAGSGAWAQATWVS